MRIFKKLFITFIFSLLFILNVKADEIKYIIPSTQEGRIDLISNFISTDIYSNFIEDVRQGNFNRSINNTYYDFTDNYVLYIDFNNLNNYNFNVRFFRIGSLGLTNSSLNLGTLFNFTVTFDNVTHEIISRNFDGTLTGISYNINNETNSDGNLNIYIGPISSTYPTYFDTTFLTSLDYTFINNYYFDNGNALLQLNQGNYARGEQVPTKYFFETMNSIFAPPNENPNKCVSYNVGSQIGIVRNVKSISFRVHDTSNVLNYPIEGYFRMVSSQFNDIMIPISDYLDVNVSSGPLNEGDYNFNYNMYWVNENGTTINDILTPRYGIYFDYDLIAEDDIDTYLDVIITLTIKDTIPVGNITFFDNPVDIYANIYNCNLDLISYGYVDNNNNYTSSDSVLINYLQDNNLGNISSLTNTDIIGDGPVDSILLLPLNIMRNLLNVLNSNTCQPIVLPLPNLNSNITLPCVNTLYNQINGLSTFLNWFSAIASAFILYEYFIRLYKWVDNLLTFRENNHFGGF